MTNAKDSNSTTTQIGEITAGVDSLDMNRIDLDKLSLFEADGARIATLTPLPGSIGVTSIDDTVRVSIDCDRFTVVSDWGGTRAPKIFPDFHDPLFAEYLADNFQQQSIMKAITSILHRAREGAVTVRLGLRSNVRLQQKSLHPSIISGRLQMGSDQLTDEQNEVVGLLLTAYYNHINMLADTPRIIRLSAPKKLVPTRDMLINRATKYRTMSALQMAMKSLNEPLDFNELNTAAIDAHMAKAFEALMLASIEADRARDYLELGLEAMRAYTLRETMPDLPSYIVTNPKLPGLCKDATLLFAALHPNAHAFAMTLGSTREVLADTAKSANYAAYAAFLDPALEFIEGWISNDPYFTTTPISSAVDCLSVARSMEPTTKTIRGGVIRFALRDIDPAATLAYAPEGQESSYFALASGLSTSLAGAPLISSMQPVIRDDSIAALTELLASSLQAHARGHIATFVSDPDIVTFAAMALSDEVVLQFDVDPEVKGEYFVLPDQSELTMLFRHRISDAAGYLSDLQSNVIADMIARDRVGVADRGVLDNNAQADGAEPPLPFEVDPRTMVDGRFAMRVGASEHVYTIDPRIVLLSAGERSVRSAWDIGVHKVDFQSMHRQFTIGTESHAAAINRTNNFSEKKIGRFGALAISMTMERLMSLPDGASLFLQPMQRMQMDQFFTVFQTVNDYLQSLTTSDMPAENIHLYRQLLSSRILTEIQNYLGSSDQSRLAHIVRTFAYEMQRAGVLKSSLSRYPDDDRRLALFILQSIYISALGTFSSVQLDDDNDSVLRDIHELVQTDEFKQVFSTSALALNIAL